MVGLAYRNNPGMGVLGTAPIVGHTHRHNASIHMHHLACGKWSCMMYHKLVSNRLEVCGGLMCRAKGTRLVRASSRTSKRKSFVIMHTQLLCCA